jgi:hypothetical protein
MLLPNPHRLWVRLLLMAGAAGLFVVGYQWGNRVQRHRAEPPGIGGVLIRPPVTVPDIRLQDPRGRTFDRRTLSAGWTLMAFGDLSQAGGQLAVQRLIDVYNRVSDREGLYRDLRLALVGPAQAPDLALAFSNLSPALYILGGEPTQVEDLIGALGAAPDGPAGLFVLAPGGYLVALLTADQDRPGLASDLVALYEHADLLLPEKP